MSPPSATATAVGVEALAMDAGRSPVASRVFATVLSRSCSCLCV
jgi:hypothetical protein